MNTVISVNHNILFMFDQIFFNLSSYFDMFKDKQRALGLAYYHASKWTNLIYLHYVDYRE